MVSQSVHIYIYIHTSIYIIIYLLPILNQEPQKPKSITACVEPWVTLPQGCHLLWQSDPRLCRQIMANSPAFLGAHASNQREAE